MKKLTLLLLGMICLGVIGGCARKNTGKEVVPEEIASVAVIGWGSERNLTGSPAQMLPKPTAFRMNGDYANNVAITLDAQGNLTYFPDPRDITEESKPISLGDGWWLNRQGLSANSVFTKYTFEEYSKLKNVPSPKELKASIIPGARVVEMKVLAD